MIQCIGIVFIMWCDPPPVPAQQVGAAFCTVARPIYWSAQDTRATKVAVDIHNRRGARLCGWGRK